MNIFKNFFKNKKASELTEKIIMVAFAVAMGGATIVYAENVINDSKNVTVEMPVGYNSKGTELIPGHYYKFKREMGDQDFSNLVDTDMEYFSVSNVYTFDGEEIFFSNRYPVDVFFGYSAWHYDDNTQEYRLDVCDCFGGLYSYYSEKTFKNLYGSVEPWCNDDYPRLNGCGCDGGFNYYNNIFKCGGQWVRQGNGPSLIEYLEEVTDFNN